MVAGKIAHMRGECRPLQVGQRTRHGVDADAFDGRGQRAVGTDQHGARDEQLGDVDVERRLRGTQGGCGEVDQDGRGGDDDHVARVEPAVRNPSRMKTSYLLPQQS